MTTATPLARYGAVERPLAIGFATTELHRSLRHDPTSLAGHESSVIPCLAPHREQGAIDGTADAWFDRDLSELRFAYERLSDRATSESCFAKRNGGEGPCMLSAGEAFMAAQGNSREQRIFIRDCKKQQLVWPVFAAKP